MYRGIAGEGFQCADVPYPLIVGFVEGNNVCSIYWMVSNMRL